MAKITFILCHRILRHCFLFSVFFMPVTLVTFRHKCKLTREADAWYSFFVIPMLLRTHCMFIITEQVHKTSLHFSTSWLIHSQKIMLLFSLLDIIYFIKTTRDTVRDDFMEIAFLLRAASCMQCIVLNIKPWYISVRSSSLNVIECSAGLEWIWNIREKGSSCSFQESQLIWRK